MAAIKRTIKGLICDTTILLCLSLSTAFPASCLFLHLLTWELNAAKD